RLMGPIKLHTNPICALHQLFRMECKYTTTLVKHGNKPVWETILELQGEIFKSIGSKKMTSKTSVAEKAFSALVEVDNAEIAPPTPGGASTVAPGTDYAQTPHSTFGDSHDMQNFQVHNAEMVPPTPGGASTTAPGTDYAQTPHSTFGDSHDMQNFQIPEEFQTPHHDPAHGAHAHDPASAELQKFTDFEPPKVDEPHKVGEQVDNAEMAPPTPGGASTTAPGTDYAQTPHSTFGDSHDMQNFQIPEEFQTPDHDPAHGGHAHDLASAELQKFTDFEPPKVVEPPKVGEQ
ncbi:unnamed protein product, partial [Meganyctiphanes norvegica]